MKVFSLLLAVLILLTGCAQEIPETLPPETQVPETLPAETLPPETEPTETEPTDPLEALLAMMPLEHKVGQLFLARHPEGNGLEDVKQFHLGGFILFARDLQGRDRDRGQSQIPWASFQAYRRSHLSGACHRQADRPSSVRMP